MTSIGERLRRQRLQNKMSIEKIALDTKISARLLEAIEAEQFEKLPGGVFRRSFVLQYARALGLDPDEISAELKHLSQFDDVPVIPVPPVAGVDPEPSAFGLPLRLDLSGVGGSTLGSLIAAVGVMMACALIYSWWQQAPHQPSAAPKVAIAADRPPKTVTPAPAATAPMETAPPTGPAQVAQIQAGASPVQVGLSADEKTWISISSDGK